MRAKILTKDRAMQLHAQRGDEVFRTSFAEQQHGMAGSFCSLFSGHEQLTTTQISNAVKLSIGLAQGLSRLRATMLRK